MGNNNYSGKNTNSIRKKTDKDLDEVRLLGPNIIPLEDDLITQIRKWYVKTKFNTFLKKIALKVQGQSELSLIVYEVYHYLGLIAKGQSVDKQRVILAGPSGCGKTETYRAFKEYFGKEIPKLVVSLIDTTSITPEGFVGANTNALVQAIKRGRSSGIAIVILDELDKRLIPEYASNGDNVNRQVQDQILLALEGCELDGVDTSKTLFIGMGSFNEIRERREHTKKFGFGVERKEKTIEHYDAITKEDIIKLGASYELIGRFGQVVNYGPLSPDAIDRIIDMRLDDISNSRGIKVSVNDNMRCFLHENSNTEFGNRLIESLLNEAVTRAMVEILTDEINAEEIVVIGPGKFEIKEASFASSVLKKKYEQIQKKEVERRISSNNLATFTSRFGKKEFLNNRTDYSFSSSFHGLDEEDELDAMLRRIHSVISVAEEKIENGNEQDITDNEEDKEFHQVHVACKKNENARSIAKLIAEKNGDTIKKNMEKLKSHQSVVIEFNDYIAAVVFKTSVLAAGGEAKLIEE